MSISVIAIELTLPNACHQILHSQLESQLLPASPGGSPRSADRSDPGSFKLLPLCWYLENVRFYMHIENGLSALVPASCLQWNTLSPSLQTVPTDDCSVHVGGRGGVQGFLSPPPWPHLKICNSSSFGEFSKTFMIVITKQNISIFLVYHQFILTKLKKK